MDAGPTNTDTNIPLEQCQDGYLYRIDARSASLGIFCAEKKSFFISRFTIVPPAFLFTEEHWDVGKPHGTAKALEVLEKAPDFDYDKDEEAVLKYLEDALGRYGDDDSS